MGSGNHLPPGMVDEILRMSGEGMNAPAIARALGIHENTVRKHVDRHIDAERTPDKAVMAREMFANGASVTKVARATNITIGYAKAIRRAFLGEERPCDDQLAVSVWRMFSRGWEPSAIDRALGIGNSREIIVYEWLMDRKHRPSLVGSTV